MRRIKRFPIAIVAALTAFSSYSLAQEATTISADELIDPPDELSGARVKVDGGRIFAASPRAAVLKVDDVYLSLSFGESDESGFPWQDCRGLEPVDECRMSVSGTLVVRPGRDRAELHDAVPER